MHQLRNIATFCLCMIVLAGYFIATPAFAQATSPTQITVGEIVSPWIQVIMAAAASLIVALAGWATAILKAKTGIEIEAKHMLTLQSALTNAAGKLLYTAGDKIGGYSVDVKNRTLAQAIIYVNQSAADAVKHFDLSEKTIADMILNKVGVITAPSKDPQGRLL